MVSWVVDAFGSWYSVVYPHRGEAEAGRLVATVAAAVPLSSGSALDVGCGPGRHLAHLARLGAHPVGVDLSAPLLAEARRTRARAGGIWPLVRADMRFLPFADASFRLVTSLFTSFGYFSEAEDVQVVREWGRVLEPGGFQVLDFLNRERLPEFPSPPTERVSGGYMIREERRVELGGRRVAKHVTIRHVGEARAVADYEEIVTAYGAGELRRLLAGAGLIVRREWGEYDGSEFDPKTSSRHILLSVKERR
jgi:SAM-dependent methyltransferase